MGFGCSYHPYECSHDKYCPHCTWAEFEGHDPRVCALCQDLGFQVVKEPYATRIRVNDCSHRYQRVKVKLATQEVLPFYPAYG